MDAETFFGTAIVIVAICVMFLFMLPRIDKLTTAYNEEQVRYNLLANEYLNLTERHNNLLDRYYERTINCAENSTILTDLDNVTKENFGPMGIYYANNFYCVWVKGRNLEKISLTENHEVCHHFVEMDYGHFCENKNQTNWKLK